MTARRRCDSKHLSTFPPGAARSPYFLEAFPRLLEIVRTLGAVGLMMAPGEADVRGPLAKDIERHYQAAALPAGRRIALFSLASDAACSGFAGRNVLYERCFAGDPWRLGSLAATRYPLQDDLKPRIWARAWDARLSGTGTFRVTRVLARRHFAA